MRLLVVDDAPDIANLLAFWLRQEGYAVVLFESAIPIIMLTKCGDGADRSRIPHPASSPPTSLSVNAIIPSC